MANHPDMSKPGKTSLSERMRAYVEAGNDVPDNWGELADAFDAATIGFYAEPQTVPVHKFVGCFARARKAWCDLTGEPLV